MPRAVWLAMARAVWVVVRVDPVALLVRRILATMTRSAHLPPGSAARGGAGRAAAMPRGVYSEDTSHTPSTRGGHSRQVPTIRPLRRVMEA